ncbi:Short-chain dehydrogenase/reductase SDRA [Hibiscus syriacus]|uniref:Short-chain dehydrogenase/reductase SDRA n=1 Tax=Hibiscus syriacus TaxID=106335 RepID=A0A6A3B8W2_HIBSY|nr:Short-chain dehydrogenase/reductase SDRA [Hibiscus syriacus]
MENKVAARRFEGKVAIVTASTQGIASSLKKNVDEAVEKLKAKGIHVFGVVCQVSDAQQRKNLINATVEKYGKIDVIVSNAAVNADAAPHLKKGSSIIFISSYGGYQPQPSMAMYGVTKTALLGLTKALAAELAPNVRVNAIAPGFVPTRFAAFVTANETTKKSFEDITLLKRLGTPEEIGAAAAFLSSDDASYVTGEILIVAGGTASRL